MKWTDYTSTQSISLATYDSSISKVMGAPTIWLSSIKTPLVRQTIGVE